MDRQVTVSVDDPIRRQWERVRPRSAEEWAAAEQDDQLAEQAAEKTPVDPLSLHAGAMPMNQPEQADPIRAWLDQ